MGIEDVIKELEKYPNTMSILGVSAIGDSYIGYYKEFALEPGETTVGELSSYLYDEVIGNHFDGYKGGVYTMTRATEVYIADYGSSGPLLKGFSLIGDSLCCQYEYEE